MSKDENNKLTSEGLAGLVISALVIAEIIKSEDSERALEIATEEIQVRKWMGDY